MSLEQITDRMRKGEAFCKKIYSGESRISGAVYHADEEHWNFICEIMRMFIVVNPLHCDEFMPVT